jgi:hypothetical protein
MLRRVVVLAVLGTLAASPAWALRNYVEKEERLVTGASLPFFRGRDLEGREVRSEELTASRSALVVFWSMYCKACVEKFGSLARLRQKYLPQRLGILSVCTDGEFGAAPATVKEFVAGLERRERISIGFPVMLEGGDGLARALGISFLPAVLAVDPAGRIVGIYRGFNEDSEDAILRGIETIIPEDAREPPP